MDWLRIEMPQMLAGNFNGATGSLTSLELPCQPPLEPFPRFVANQLSAQLLRTTILTPPSVCLDSFTPFHHFDTRRFLPLIPLALRR